MTGGEAELSAALKNARTSPSPIVMMGRMNLIIVFAADLLDHQTCGIVGEVEFKLPFSRRGTTQVYHALIPPISILYMYLHVLLQYNARVADKTRRMRGE